MYRKITVMLILLIVSPAYFVNAAEEDQETLEYKFIKKHNIGVAAGFTSGFGLSYRYMVSNGYGLQLTFTPFFNSSEEGEKKKDYYTKEELTLISIGLIGIKTLYEAKYVNLLAYTGFNGYYKRDKDKNGYWGYKGKGWTDEKEYKFSTTIHEQKIATLGGGVGFDFHFGNISIDIMGGVRAFYENRDDFGMRFSGEFAFLYSY